MTRAHHLPGGMRPWLCEYDGPGGRYCITLHGTDPDQVLRDNAQALPGLTVLGELHEIIPATDSDT